MFGDDLASLLLQLGIQPPQQEQLAPLQPLPTPPGTSFMPPDLPQPRFPMQNDAPGARPPDLNDPNRQMPGGVSPHLNYGRPMQGASMGGGGWLANLLGPSSAQAAEGPGMGGGGLLGNGSTPWGPMLMALGGGIAGGASQGWGAGIGQGLQGAALARMRGDENAQEEAYRQAVLKMKQAEMGAGEIKDIKLGDGRTITARVGADGTIMPVDTSAFGESTAPQFAISDPKERASTESTMRKEYTSLSGDYIKVRDSYAKINEAARDPSPAGDMAVIFNYMRLLDPGSTVREGEYATAQNAGSVPQRIRAQYNAVVDGTKLDETMRADFLKQSKGLFGAQERAQKKLSEQFRKTAKASGIDPENVVVDFTLDEPPAEQEAPATSAAPAAAISSPTVDAGLVPTGKPKRRRYNPQTQQFEEIPAGQ